MTTFIAYANIQQSYPFDEIPCQWVPETLRSPFPQNPLVRQRYQCRRLAHFLLWQLLKVAGKDTALLGKIERTESGRPYFPNEMIDFNISHSGDWVAVILDIPEKGEQNRQSAVGIDIEFPKSRDFSALIAHFAPQEEVAWFEQQADAESAFYRCWCLREAVLKSQGVGIVKLSEVRHLPCEQKIFSEYCPPGELFFTETLPFYFAAFINRRQHQVQFFCWEGGVLVPKKPSEIIRYQVNES
ncbi:4'-phosphopantetheinyl transferase family protein [Rodentibacter trehalosifermentans]|uniref:4'-phosphopantetheinyl transferase family protein n=1 Tax=Rodentibacter trehalosifermentans TaxID=1908263 RepID=UPI0009847665|nr:4'-phosphopantetheinyl transferase superfamily protein [Rodentibacter trehalosifermentans]OOF49817.1 4'-phosphopantetheinyl transferase [Rodentibacter trehalosifermentans]